MITASICTIGDEILIGQVTDTNSGMIARELGNAGVRVSRMLSVGDDHDCIVNTLRNELSDNDIVITTGGLGPTKDDITKAALAELSGNVNFVCSEVQLAIIRKILHDRGLDSLDVNISQAMVPESCEVIPNRLGTAPIMVFRFDRHRFGRASALYALPGVPFEASAAMPDVMEDIRKHHELDSISHRNIMVYGMAESALSKKIGEWENSLPEDMHLAYLPNPLTGVRLRLSIYGSKDGDIIRMEEKIAELKNILGDLVYSDEDDSLENTVGRLLKKTGKTLSVAESCTGGEISQLITSVPGSSAYYLGSVTSYAVAVKEKVLGVPAETIARFGVVSGEVAVAMAEGVRRLLGSDYSLATTGLAGPGGDEINPVGTVWIGVAGPNGSHAEKLLFHSDRKRNIDRFSSSALDILRKMIDNDLNS